MYLLQLLSPLEDGIFDALKWDEIRENIIEK